MTLDYLVYVEQLLDIVLSSPLTDLHFRMILDRLLQTSVYLQRNSWYLKHPCLYLKMIKIHIILMTLKSICFTKQWYII